MKTLATLALAALVLLAGPATAQEPADAGVFADPEGTQTTLNVIPNVPYNVYIVAFDLPDFFAYEASMSGIPAGTTFALSTTYAGPAPLDVGQPAAYNYIVGAGGCVPGAGANALVAVQFLSVVAPAADTAIVLGGSTPSSFSGLPGYAECDETTIGTFGVATDGGDYPDGALILNATQTGPVDNEESSFGNLKARF